MGEESQSYPGVKPLPPPAVSFSYAVYPQFLWEHSLRLKLFTLQPAVIVEPA